MKLIANSRRLDRLTYQRTGLPEPLLMEAAGLQAAEFLHRNTTSFTANILILVGPGNNGGDALVMARHLWSRGYTNLWLVAFWPQGMENLRSETLRRQAKLAEAFGLRLHIVTEATPLGPETFSPWDQLDWVVDGLLGVGLSRPVDGIMSRWLAWWLEAKRSSQTQARGLALDIPTGLDASTGQLLNGLAFDADYTVTFGPSKPGLHLDPGRQWVGEVIPVAIGLPPGVIKETPADAWLMDSSVRQWLPPRPADAHKYQFGHTLIIGGSEFFPGAAWLTARAALASGCGLVTLAAKPSVLNAGFCANTPEVIHYPLPEDKPANSLAPEKSIQALSSLLDEGKVNSIVIGPGLGKTSATHILLLGVLRYLEKSQFVGTVLLDADALNVMAAEPEQYEWLKQSTLSKRICLTPHPGEAQRLCPELKQSPSPLDSAKRLRETWKTHVVLKGSNTVVAPADDDQQLFLSPYGHSGMATAGSGDVLSGLLGGLGAQGVASHSRPQNWNTLAPLGVVLHGLAGDKARPWAGSYSMTASDIIDALPQAFDSLLNPEHS